MNTPTMINVSQEVDQALPRLPEPVTQCICESSVAALAPAHPKPLPSMTGEHTHAREWEMERLAVWLESREREDERIQTHSCAAGWLGLG